MNPDGTCALCQAPNVELIDSHIVSRWLYRRLIAFDPAAGAHSVEVADGRAILSSRQVTEYLLCRPCEDLLGASERYVADAGLQPDDTFPLRDRGVLTEVDATIGLAHADLSAFDIEKIVHFAVSVFWRADVAQIEPIVHLGDVREEFRPFLLGRGPLPASANLVMTILRPPAGAFRVDRVLLFPETQDSDRHDFVACGIHFVLYTGNVMPELRKMELPVAKAAFVEPGKSLTQAIANQTQASRAVGKLGEEQRRRRRP